MAAVVSQRGNGWTASSVAIVEEPGPFRNSFRAVPRQGLYI